MSESFSVTVHKGKLPFRAMGENRLITNLYIPLFDSVSDGYLGERETDMPWQVYLSR
jgi:hypothetical protein